MPQDRLATLRRIAFACAVLVLAIASLSSFIRLSRAGLGCEPWPQCHVQRAAMGAAEVAAFDTPAVTHARVAHRFAASAALLLVIALLMKSLAQQPPLKRQGQLAFALLVLALFLAILGRMAGDSRATAVAVGNLVGGFAMFALTCRLAVAPARRWPLHPAWVLGALALLLAEAALGAAVSAEHASSRCGDLAVCALHGWSAALVAPAVAVVGVLGWRAGLRAGGIVVVLALLQVVWGLGMLVFGVPLALAVLHNLTGALLLAALLGLLA